MDTDSRFSICLPCQMLDILSFVRRVAPYAFGPILGEAGYLISYEGNFKELADHVKEVEAKRGEINHLVEAETRNGKIIEPGVQNWLDKVNEVIEKANKLLEDSNHAEVGCSGWVFPNLISRHQFSKKASEIAKDVVQVRGKENFKGVCYLPPLDGAASSSGTRGDENLLETRETFKEEIVKALKDPKALNIGVYGLGGVGKTTLVKEVAKIAKKEKLFDAVVMANVSKTPDIKKIQGEIADRLGLQFGEKTVPGRASRLRQRIIKEEKTILVILDDIWTTLDLEEVGIPSGTGSDHDACKLLMTSRNEHVLLKMDAQKDFIFRLEALSGPETWSLFQNMAGDVVNDISFKDVAIQVAQKCGGLPLSVVTVARALKDRRIYAWKDALRQLQSVDLDHEGVNEKTYSALELSYNWLESDETKQLFLLSAVVNAFHVEYLLKVAMGLDIFKSINTVEDARNRLHNIIESLKASCLLLEGNTSVWIQMHDIVREVAISIASRDQHVFVGKPKAELKEWPTKDFLKRCSQLILHKCHIHELPQRLDCPNIKFFYLYSSNRSLEIPDTFFEGMGSLKVLDLSCLNLSSLPTSFRYLTDLQTLCLYHCILENMDAIGALKKLKILTLCKSSMIKLPSEIGTLTNLRMLDLSGSRIEVIPPNIISSLTKLEELYMGYTSVKWEDENSAKQSENASLSELRQLSNLTALQLQIREAWILPRDMKLVFEKLQRFKIVIGDVWEWYDNKDQTLKALKLKLGTNVHLEHEIKALIKGVENLCLDKVHDIQNVLYREGFPLLKHLHIQNNTEMKHIVDYSLVRKNHIQQVSFLNLETLVLVNLQNLEEICHGTLAVNSFSKLRVIKVQNCNQLKYLLSILMVKGLSQLSEIQVSRCNSMETIVLGDGDITTDKIEFFSLHSLTLQHLQAVDHFFSHELKSPCVPLPLFSAQVAFPKLDTLKLSSLKLSKIWEDNQHSMYNLRSLIVESCGELKYLFSSATVGSFMNLKRLEISKCHLMDEIITTEEKNTGTIASEEVRFSKLETIILKDMQNLKTVWHYQFDTMKTLQVNNCEKILVVFPFSMRKTYHNLEMLEVTNCALVEEIFELTSNAKGNVEDTTQLKGITLNQLPKLKRIWSRGPQGILSFCNLENVHVSECKSLEYLFPLSIATSCSHLKDLQIKYCGNMKEIVAEEKESTCPTPILFQFNHLNTLLLWGLLRLKGFYAGNYTLVCPSLRSIDVSFCEKLNLFKVPSTDNERVQDDKLPVLVQQPLFIDKEVIPNLEWLRLDHGNANVKLQAQHLGAFFTKLTFLGLNRYKNEEVTFPYWFLQNAKALQSLCVERSSFKKIFQDERHVSEKIYIRLKRLTLIQLPELEDICEEGSQVHPIIEFLEYLKINECHSLTNLLPSSGTFSHLISLEITNCNGLKSLITSPMAQSLGKLKEMKVKDCKSLKEIITGKEDVNIEFISLEVLKLECLSSLNKFCSNKCSLKFPLLKEVFVRECPQLEIFSEGYTSTPYLRKVKVTENGEKWLWKGSLNDTIKNMFENKVS